MAHNILEDHARFRKIIDGKVREDLKKYIDSGSIFKLRPDGRVIRIPIPKIHTPIIWWGENEEGVGRGQGKKGDKISAPKPKNGKGDKPGTMPGEGMLVDVDIEEVFKLLKDELKLPDMKPKPNKTFEEVRTIYNGLSKTGPRSLIHKRKTMLAALKRLAALGKLNEKQVIPGFSEPVTSLSPINDDFRYRQYNEIKVPSSNAVIFFMRDGSGSMGGQKTEIVHDLTYWLNLYISHYYSKVEKVYIWHDSEAKRLSEKDFFRMRDGGGTVVSSAFNMAAKMVKEEYSPDKWNIYVFYFGDGENSEADNEKVKKLLRNQLGPKTVNMVGQVEILYSGYFASLKASLDKDLKEGKLTHLRNTEIKALEGGGNNWWQELSEEQRFKETKRILKELLGTEQERKVAENNVILQKVN